MSYAAQRPSGNDERGMGLLLGMVATAIVALLAWAMTTNGMIDLTISDHYRNYSAAFYAADGGVEQTLIDFKIDEEWIPDLLDMRNWVPNPPGGTTLTVNGSTVTVQLDADGYIVPDWYPFGEETVMGQAAYTREVYLPPLIAPGECDPAEASSGASGSGASESGSASSGGSDSDSDGSVAAVFDSLASLATSPRFLVAGAAAGGAKVAVCHIPPGNPDNAHTINISTSALSAHEAHGDSAGACAEDSDSEGSDSDDSQSLIDDPCAYLDSLSGSSSSSSGASDSGASESGGSDSGDSGSEDETSDDGGKGKGKGKGKGDGPVASLFDAVAAGFTRAGLLFAPTAMLGTQQFPKVEICHVPPGNPDNAHTIEVGAAAVGAHMEHPGDTVGTTCEERSGSSDSDSGSDDSDDADSESGDTVSGSGGGDDDAAPTSAYVILRVRSTGTRLTSSTRIQADLVFLIGADGTLLNMAVQDWREIRTD